MPDTLKSDLLPIVNTFPTRSESLVLRAEALMNTGDEEKLEAEDRRDAVMYLMGVRPDLNNLELARVFKVNEKTIRTDKELIRKRVAEEIVKGDDISLFVSDLRRAFENIKNDLAKSTKKCEMGTNTWLAHKKFEWELEQGIVARLQDLGVLPKNLGNLTKTEFIFKAHVAKGGGVNTVPVESQEELKTIEAQEYKLLPGAHESDEDKAIRSQFEAQFADTAVKEEEAAPVAPTRVQRG
jgi:hypothetical protein